MGSDKKWIYLSYIVGALILAWVLDQALKMIAGYARVPNPMVLDVLPASTILSVLAMVAFTFFYTRQQKVQTFSLEVIQELRKVTWPTQKNTYLSTVVVVVTVIIAAAILGFFDWICTQMVGLVLKA